MDEALDAIGCAGGNAVACGRTGTRVTGAVQDGVDGVVENVSNSALGSFADAMYEFAVWILEVLSTWWLSAPNADVENAAVTQIQNDIHFYVIGFAMIGFLMGLVRMVASQDIKAGIQGAFKPIFNLIMVTGVYAIGVTMLLEAGDAAALWLMERATEGETELSVMFMPTMANGSGVGTMLLIYLLSGLGGIVNFVFMIFRNLLLVVLMAFMPALAAATGTQRGDQAFGKANGWLIALLLFKPVAATVYALGFRLMREGSEMEGFQAETQTAVDQLTGAGIIVLAALALPALVKFLVPAAATGAGAFSGAAAVGAGVGVAAGAAVLAGTGGAGAGAAAGGAASSGGASASGGGPSGALGSSTGGGSSGGGGADSGGSGSATASGASSSGGGGAAGAEAPGGAAASGSSGASSESGASTDAASGGDSSGSGSGGETTPSGSSSTGSSGEGGGDSSASGGGAAAGGAAGGTGQAGDGSGSSGGKADVAGAAQMAAGGAEKVAEATEGED